MPDPRPADQKFDFADFIASILAKQVSGSYPLGHITFTSLGTDVEVTAVGSAATPEPISIMLFGSGLAGLGLLKRCVSGVR